MKITTKDIQVGFHARQILKGISIESKDKELVGIIGPNGSGKSTLLKCIYRILKPDAGAVYLDGEELHSMSVKSSARKMAVVAQHNYYNFDFTVREVVLMGRAETFHGYAPDLGYEFLRSAIVKNDYQARGCDITVDEIFVSDGAKSDSGNIQEIFAQNNRIAVCDPVYPVYVDSNVMAGRTGTYDPETEMWSDVIYMPCTMENNFVPEFPKETPDII